MNLPKGYRPVTLAEMLWHFKETMPGLAPDLMRHMGMTRDALSSRVVVLESQGLMQFAIAPNGEPSVFFEAHAKFKSLADVTLAQRLLSYWDAQGDFDAERGQMVGRQPLPPHDVPHWQKALDRKFEAMKYLRKLDDLVIAGAALKMSPMLLADMTEDMAALKAAEVYSFNADTMHAILTGSQSIPHETSLKSIELPPSQAGWFWFADPFPAASSPISSEFTHALLWTWDMKVPVPTLRFSAYVVDEKGTLDSAVRGTILPSTKWYWPIDATFHEMIALNHQWYQNGYGPNSPNSPGKEFAVGEKATLSVIADMSLFFLMACLWFKQTVAVKPKLTQEKVHIERHARKRYQKEWKLNEAPTVRVIALRKSAVSEVASEISEAGVERKLKVRFVVSGHPRLQACGPGRLDRKLIWIDAYPKGPEDAPFKESVPKVFAVIR